MVKFLPIIFLVSFSTTFGLSWIVFGVDPDSAPWWVYGLFVLFLFFSVWGFLGILVYFARTKIHKRYSKSWYFRESFKIAFFVAIFLAISAILSILGLVTTVNVFLATLALVLFAVWSYLGRKSD